jgi:curved DNA-binding protein CbpA
MCARGIAVGCPAEPVQHRDPQGHYAILNVGPDASREEILLSYRFLKLAFRERREKLNIGAIQDAYEVLSDAERKAAYDGASRPAHAMSPLPGSTPRFSSLVLLVSLVVALMVVLAVMHGPQMLYSMTTFPPGDNLYLLEDGAFLGTVSAYEARHTFHNGAHARAYQLRTRDDGPGEWYPAGDLARIAEAR